MTWMLTDAIAEKTAGIWSLRSQLSAPDLGWRIGCGETADAEGLLAISSSVAMPEFQEAYWPEEDLVARYAQNVEPGISLDVRYQLLTVSPARLVLQATFAVQTRGFETHPALEITVPKIAENKIDTINRFRADRFDAAVVMQASDVAQSRLLDDGASSRIQFYGDFMERGVIRKCRLRLILSPLSSQELQAEEELAALTQEPLPLVS